MNGQFGLLLRIVFAHFSARVRQTVIATLGVAVGVASFLAVSAMMIGSQSDLIRTLVDSAPHIIVRDQYREAPEQPSVAQFSNAAVEIHGLYARDEVRGLRDWQAMLADSRSLQGAIAAPALTGAVAVRFAGRTEALALSGIDPRLEDRVANINEDLVGGALGDLESVQTGIIIPAVVSQRLGAHLGDTLLISSPAGVVQNARLVALLSGSSRGDAERVAYTSLRTAQVLFKRPNIVNQLHVRLADPQSAPQVATTMEARWGYEWETWQQRSRDITNAFAIHNIITYAVISAILFVASLGIYSLISTNVTEKHRDIAVLHAIGFSASDIECAFLLEGVMLGMLGALLGFILGYGLIEAMAAAPFTVQGQNHTLPLDRGFFQYLVAGSATVFAATIAAWIPARRAGRLDPVDILRGAA